MFRNTIIIRNGFLTEFLLHALWLTPSGICNQTVLSFGPTRCPALALVSTAAPVTGLWKMYHQGQTHRPTKAVRSARHTLVGYGSAGRPLPAWKPNTKSQAPPARAPQSPQSSQVYNNIASAARHTTNTSEPGSKVYIQGLPKV